MQFWGPGAKKAKMILSTIDDKSTLVTGKFGYIQIPAAIVSVPCSA